MAIAPSVLSYLEQQDVAFEILRHPRSYSSAQLAEHAGIDDAHLAKAVLLSDDDGDLLVVIPACFWVALGRINKQLGRTLELAGETAVDLCFHDCRPGAVPPFGMVYGLETLLDESLTSLAYVYFESGDHEQLLVVTQEAFSKLMLGARVGHYSKQE